MSLGEKLRSARLKQQRTPSQIAAATRMKVQLVEAIEREDFSKMAAPIYGKGFIKLYAEQVGLDPAPLIEEYTARFVRGGSMSAAEGAKIAQASQPRPPQPDPVLTRKPAEKPADPGASRSEAEERSSQVDASPQQDEPQDDAGKKRPVEKLLALARGEVEPTPGPATPPQVQAEEDIAERDLFDDLVDSKEDRDFGHQEKLARPKISPRDFIKAVKEKLVKEVFLPSGELWSKGLMSVRTKSRAAWAGLREGRVRISMPKNIWTLRVGSQVKLISLLAGAVVIIILLVSGLSTCGRDPGDGTLPPPDDARIRQPLVTAIDPPDPYLE